MSRKREILSGDLGIQNLVLESADNKFKLYRQKLDSEERYILYRLTNSDQWKQATFPHPFDDKFYPVLRDYFGWTEKRYQQALKKGRL